jgi:hypothetical protein
MPTIEFQRVPKDLSFIKEPATFPPTAPLTNWIIKGNKYSMMLSPFVLVIIEMQIPACILVIIELLRLIP